MSKPEAFTWLQELAGRKAALPLDASIDSLNPWRTGGLEREEMGKCRFTAVWLSFTVWSSSLEVSSEKPTGHDLKKPHSPSSPNLT